MRWNAALVAVCTLFATAACHNVEYGPSISRGISDDIDVARNIGPTGQMPGMTQAGEPLGALPWNLGERR